MRRSLTLASLAIASLAVTSALGVGAAVAADGDAMANLQPVPLNGVNGSGSAMVAVNGTTIDVTMSASGLLADVPTPRTSTSVPTRATSAPPPARMPTATAHSTPPTGTPPTGPSWSR